MAQLENSFESGATGTIERTSLDAVAHLDFPLNCQVEVSWPLLPLAGAASPDCQHVAKWSVEFDASQCLCNDDKVVCQVVCECHEARARRMRAAKCVTCLWPVPYLRSVAL